MQRAIDLARQGGVDTRTNPNVGAVIVYDGEIIGEGFHTKFGAPHAEREAIASVPNNKKELLRLSTLYVTLEPCCIHSKTPPCTDAILEAGIPKVVIGSKDPNEPMNGKSLDLLRAKGIEVEEQQDFGQACNDLIRPFKAHLEKRPYIILKWAQTLDNYIGKRDQQVWLSNDYSKTMSHEWRSQANAILVGYNTVVTDNPSLTTRLVKGPNPLRIVIDWQASLDDSYTVLSDDNPSIIINCQGLNKSIGNKRYHHIERDEEFIPNLMAFLFELGIYYLIVEGGTKTINMFIKGQNWDEARVIKTHQQLGSGVASPKLRGRRFRVEYLESDRIDYIYPY